MALAAIPCISSVAWSGLPQNLEELLHIKTSPPPPTHTQEPAAAAAQSSPDIITAESPQSSHHEKINPHDPGAAQRLLLPPEILGLVFALAVPQLQLQEFGQFFGPPAARPVPAGERPPHAVRQSLGLVCRAWAAVLQRTPAAWTTLVVSHAVPPAALRRALRRSGALPLDLFLDLPWHGRAPSREHASATLEIVRAALPRTRALVAFQPSHHMFRALFPPGGGAAAVDAPHLAVFQFVTSGPCADDGQPAAGCINAPRLEVLDVDAHTYPAPTNLARARLRRIGLSPSVRMSARALLALLADCPNVESVCLPRPERWCESDDDNDDGDDGDHAAQAEEDRAAMRWPAKSVALPSLRHLKLSFARPRIALHFCAALQLSTLETLDFSAAFDGSPVPALEHLLLADAASSTLLDLTIRSHPPTRALTGAACAPLLARLPRLRSLHVVYGSVDADLLAAALAPPAGRACRDLASLEFTHVSLPVDDLVRLLETTAAMTIKCVGCPGFKDHHVSRINELQRNNDALQVCIQ